MKMNVFTCEKCNRKFRRKDYLKKHIGRKFPCKEVKKKISIKESLRITKNHQESLRITKNHQESFYIKKKKKKEFDCEYCNKKISKRLINRHQREVCIKIPKLVKHNLIDKYNNNKKHIKALELSKLVKCENKKNSNINNIINATNSLNTTNNTINNTTNNTLNNITNHHITVKINPLGEENTDFLKKKDILKIINRCYMAIPELIETIHNRPENRNFYISNINKKTIAYLNKKNEISYNNYENICEKIINSNIKRLDKYFNEFEKELTNNIKKRMINILKENFYEELNEKYIKNIKFYLMNISKNNKKELNKFIDIMEEEIKNEK